MSEIKVNKISPRTACGTTTLGDSGDTFTIPAGATITNSGTANGFGATGAVNWQTGSIKTGDFTAANGEGYFVNTTSGEITVTLPSASAGDIIAVQDYNNTFDSNQCIIQPPSGVKINGGTAAGTLKLTTEGQGLTLVYVDATVGWRSVDSTTFSSGSTVPAYVTATGGTVTTVDTNFKVHTFTGPGTFCVSAGNGPLAIVDYLVVAGGGGTARDRSGGGGAGGYREAKTGCNGSYTASPLATPTGIQITGPVAIPITVGSGGTDSPSSGGNTPGGVSVFSTITSAGGGAGNRVAPQNGSAGGSGGGGGYASSTNGCGGAGNTPATNPAQGQPGGNANYPTTGGGGGATAAGNPGPGGKQGGNGATSSITGSPVARAGGGGGIASGSGGTGGGGNGSADCSPTTPGGNGTANTGGGAGGGGSNVDGGTGGSGVVIIRYRFQA